MKQTKIIVALALAGMFAFSPALLAAEKKGKRPEGAERGKGGPAGGMAAIFEKLDLTDAQKEKLKAVNEERGKIFRDQNLSQEDKRAKAQELQGKMREILTPEQQKKMRELMQAAGRGKDAPAGKGKGDRKKKEDK